MALPGPLLERAPLALGRRSLARMALTYLARHRSDGRCMERSPTEAEIGSESLCLQSLVSASLRLIAGLARGNSLSYIARCPPLGADEAPPCPRTLAINAGAVVPCNWLFGERGETEKPIGKKAEKGVCFRFDPIVHSESYHVSDLQSRTLVPSGFCASAPLYDYSA
jgi:hypothetical protein